MAMECPISFRETTSSFSMCLHSRVAPVQMQAGLQASSERAWETSRTFTKYHRYSLFIYLDYCGFLQANVTY